MTNETHVISRATSAAPAACAAVRWILIERCVDVNRHPEAKTPEGAAEENDSVRRLLLAQMERPFLQGGGGVGAMILPQGPHMGAVVEIRSVRRGEEDGAGSGAADDYGMPQIIGWGGPEEVGSILRCNEILLRDLAVPESGVTVSCEYYYGTRV